MKRFVIPITMTILIALFVIQKFGTAVVGKLFGPITLLWFISLAVLGVLNVIKNPEIFAAINPLYAVNFISEHTLMAYIVMGSVVLVVTGVEALYLDMGHFGKSPVRLAWLFCVLPSLLINYFGQGALLLADPEAITSENVIAEMGRLVLTLPTRVRRATEKPIIAVSSNVAEAYRTAILGLGGGFYLYQGESVVMNWQGQYDVVECPGMSDNTMAFYQKSNLWFGTNTLDQWNTVAVLDMFEHDLSNNVRFAASFFAGVQYGFGNEIAFYQPA
jgi:hypothetical protein